MKVTVGAIRQIVREEAERLHETETGETVEVEASAEEEGPEGAMTDSALILKLKAELIALLEPVKDQWNDEIWGNIKQVVTAWASDPQIGKAMTRRVGSMLPADEGSSQTAGFTPEESGRASNESVNRNVLRNMIMGEAAAIVGK